MLIEKSISICYLEKSDDININYGHNIMCDTYVLKWL